MTEQKEKARKAEAERKRKQLEHEAIARECLIDVNQRSKLYLVAELQAISEPMGKAEGDYEYFLNIKSIVLEDESEKLLKAGKAKSKNAARAMAHLSAAYKGVIVALREAASERARLRVIKARIEAEIGVKRSIEATEREMAKLV